MSTILVNTLTGTSTAGSIAVTGEGNSTTTNLQQGLAKSWVNFNGTGTVATRDSFNHASLTDNGTGDFTLAYTSSFGNVNYASSVYTSIDATAGFNTSQFGSSTKAAANIRVTIGYDGSTNGTLTAYDTAANEMHLMGDLA